MKDETTTAEQLAKYKESTGYQAERLASEVAVEISNLIDQMLDGRDELSLRKQSHLAMYEWIDQVIPANLTPLQRVIYASHLPVWIKRRGVASAKLSIIHLPAPHEQGMHWFYHVAILKNGKTIKRRKFGHTTRTRKLLSQPSRGNF